MLKKLLLASFLASLPVALFGQNVNGNITTNSSTCSTQASCVTLPLGNNAPAPASAAVGITGSWTGTLQFEAGTPDNTGACTNWNGINAVPIGSTTGVTSTTGNGAWQIIVSGLCGVRVRASAFASGTATVNVNGSSASAGSTRGGGGGGTPASPSGSFQFNNGGSFGAVAGQVYANGMVCDGHTDDRAALQTVLSAATYGETVVIPNTTTGCYINIQQQQISSIAFSANTVTLTMAATANTAFVANGLARITGLTSADSANYNLFPGVWQLASVSGSTITFTLTNATSVTTFNPANAFLSIGVWLTQNGVSVVCGPGATNIWSAGGSQGACNLFTTPSNALSTKTSQGDIFTTSSTNGPYFRGLYAIDNQGGQGVGWARTAMGGFYIQGSQTYAFDQSGAMGFTCLGNPNEQGCGSGITLDGGSPNGNYAPTQNTSSFVQYGTMVNPEVIANRYPLTTRGKSSDLKIYGGVISCLLPTVLPKAVLIPNSIGWDQGYTWGKTYFSGANAENEGGGNWAYGTAVSQCQVGYAFMNTSNNGVVGKAENSTALGPYPDSIAGFITSTNNTNTSASRINAMELHIVGFNSGIFEDANSQNQRFTGYEQTQCSGNSFSGSAYTGASPNNCGGQISTIGAIGSGGSSGGSSWAVGDWFQINDSTHCVASGGGPGVVALGRILTVSSGAATAVAIMTRGSKYAACSGTAATSAALGASTGTGLSINITAVASSGTNQGISTTPLASNGVVAGDFSFTSSMIQDSGPTNDTIAWQPVTDSNSSPANTNNSLNTVSILQNTTTLPAAVFTPIASATADLAEWIAPGQTAPTTGVCTGTVKCSEWIDASGNLNSLGNSAIYGSGGQSTASFIRGYGSSAPNPFYIESLNGATGTIASSIFCSITVAGLCGESSSATPTGDLSTTTAFAIDPLSAADQVIGSGSGTQYGSLGVFTPTALAISSCTNALTYSSHAFGCNTTSVATTLDKVAGAAAQATATESAPGNNYTLAGMETANLTVPYVFTNANSANSNTSGALAIGVTGTSTGANNLYLVQPAAAGFFIDACGGTSSITNGTVVCGTSEFSVSANGSVTSANSVSTSTFIGTTLKGSTGSIGTALTVRAGDDVSANAAGGTLTVRGPNQTGAGGSTSSGGHLLLSGGNNAATNASSKSGSVELITGASTGATQGIQGMTDVIQVFVKGATSTQWKSQQITAASTVQDTAVSAVAGIVGIAELVNANTTNVIIAGEAFVVTTGAVTIGHNVCQSATAGEGVDSSTGCAVGTKLGVVIATSGTFTLADGTSSTATTTQPLIQVGLN